MEAEFDLIIACPPRPIFMTAALVLTVAYPAIALVALTRHARRSDHGVWTTSAPTLFATMPLAFNVPIVWLTYVRVAEGMSLSGGGRAALSAGLAESLFHLFTGALAAAITAAVLVTLPITNMARDTADIRISPIARHGVTAVMFSAVAAILTWLFSRYLFHAESFTRHNVTIATWGSLVAGLFLFAVVWGAVYASRSRTAVLPWRAHLISLAALMVVVGAIALRLWHVIALYRQIALGIASAAF